MADLISTQIKDLIRLVREALLFQANVKPRQVMPSYGRLPLEGSWFVMSPSDQVVPELFGTALRNELQSGDSSLLTAMERFKSNQGTRTQFRGKKRSIPSFRYASRHSTKILKRIAHPGVIAGRFSLFEDNWALISQDPIVRQYIRGYRLPFRGVPPSTVRQPRSVPPLDGGIQGELSALLSKGVIEPIPRNSKAFYSKIFGVPKKEGKTRIVINLKPLNKLLEIEHFKMEGLSMVPDLVKKGDFCCKIDMADAYFAVPIHPKDRNYLAFMWNGRGFRYKCLCFGLATAPYVYSRLMRCIASHLRSLGVRLIHYLDDWCLFAQSESLLLSHRDLALEMFYGLGLLVNKEKSVLEPVQSLTFLGLILNTRDCSFAIPEEMKATLRNNARDLISRSRVRIRDISEFLGRANFVSTAAPMSTFHIRSLQRLVNSEVVNPTLTFLFNKRICLPAGALEDLVWWRDTALNLPPVSFLRFSPNLTLTTDASKSGWGAVCLGKATGGRWTKEEASNHINFLELLAVLFGLRCFAQKWKDLDILIESDNTTTVAYLRRRGGTVSPSLDMLAQKIYEFAQHRGIRISAVHKPGVENIRADFESRFTLRETAEFTLSDRVCRRIFTRFGSPNVDLFATRLNSKLPRFYAAFLDPYAEKLDSFAQNWKGLYAYAFPPFNLILRTLQKANAEEANLILVTPMWKSQAWLPVALQMCAEPPLLLPKQSDLLTLPNGAPHILLEQKSFRLLVWRISQEAGEIGDWRRKLRPQFWPAGLREL